MLDDFQTCAVWKSSRAAPARPPTRRCPPSLGASPPPWPFCTALAWRRRAPLVALALAVVLVELSNLAAPALAETGAFLVGILLAIYSAGRHTRGRALIAGLLLVAAAIPLAAIEPGDPVAFTDIAFFAVLFGGPWVVGRYARHRSERERVLVAERDVRAHEAVAEERTRIGTTSSHTRSASSSCRRAAGAGCWPTSPKRRAARSTSSSTPASRRWGRCAGCSGCCATTSRS